jgi:2-aminoadipate transaminase
MSRARTRIRWDELFARRTKTSAADGLTSILALANKSDLISFAGGFPDPSTFPASELVDHFDRLAKDHDVSALQYAPVAGLPGPRSLIADRLDTDGGRPDDDELIITSGTIDSGDLVFVEGPTYLGAIMAFQSFEANVREVLMDDQGLDVDRLETAIVEYGRPKFLYTIPDHQNPAGVTLAHDRRERLVEVARHHGFLLVEDVAYRELGFGGDRLPSLWSLAPDVVVQTGTFSKTFIPGVRLGWGAGPPEIVASMVWAKQNTDQCATALGQRLLEEYGRAGGLEEQARRSRALYGRRCARLMAALEAHMPDDVSWTTPLGGFFSWLQLPDGIDGTDVARRAVDEGVAIVPGAPFFPRAGGAGNVRLSFSRIEDDLIDEGIKRLAAVIEQGREG